VSPPISPNVTQLVQSLLQERSLLDRVRGQDRRLAILTRIPGRAIRSIAAEPEFEDRAAILERSLRDDRVPAVRRLALSVLAEHLPERVTGVFPHVLLDRAASVRGLPGSSPAPTSLR
jgi:hypothetical protein